MTHALADTGRVTMLMLSGSQSTGKGGKETRVRCPCCHTDLAGDTLLCPLPHHHFLFSSAYHIPVTMQSRVTFHSAFTSVIVGMFL